MITEVTRILSAWARDPVEGVNAQLALVAHKQMDGSDDPVPPDVTVYDDIDSVGGDSEDMSLDIDPAKVPALVVAADSGASLNLHDVNYLKTGEPVIVAFGYITRDVPGKQAKLNGGYTLRALRRCLWQFKNAPKASKELNGIRVLKLDTVRIFGVAGGMGRSQMYGLLTVSVSVVDTIL